MDEFDVFLDAVSRRIALSTLVGLHRVVKRVVVYLKTSENFLLLYFKCILFSLQVDISKQMVNRQFIFITPQDLSSLKPDNRLKIIVLKPPDRGSGQQIIDFGQSQS
jgi:hypothetical protein